MLRRFAHITITVRINLLVVILALLALSIGSLAWIRIKEERHTSIPLEWANPEMAFEMAASEAEWYWGSPLTRLLYNNALRVRNSHALLDAPIGSFNDNEEEFYPWLVERLKQRDFPSTYNIRYMEAQIGAAFSNPNSPIAQKLRAIAAGKDPARPVPEGGEFAYWDYLIWPATLTRNSDLQDELMRKDFREIVYAYRRAKRQGASNTVQDFPSYLLESDFFTRWYGTLPGTQ